MAENKCCNQQGYARANSTAFRGNLDLLIGKNKELSLAHDWHACDAVKRTCNIGGCMLERDNHAGHDGFRYRYQEIQEQQWEKGFSTCARTETCTESPDPECH